MADISAVKTWGNETLTPTDLNSEFSNVYTNHVSKSTEQTVSGVKTHSAAIILQDSVNLTFGTGSDATIDYDGTNLVIDPDVVGSGVLSLQGGLTVGVDDTGYDVQVFGDTSGKFVKWDTGTDSLELPDNTNLTFGTGQDADIYYDGTNLVIDPAVVGSGIVHVSGGAMKVEIDDNAAASVKDAFTVEWDPADDGNMTDTSSGLAIAFTLPDDADTQTIMGRLQLVVNDDAAGSEDTEWQLVRMVAGSLTAQSFGASLANDANNRVTTADGSGGLNGEANLTFDGSALQVTGTVTVGVDDTGHDVTFYGATIGNYWQWDESADAMLVVGNATVGTLTAEGDGTLHVHTGTAGTASANTGGDDLVIENSTDVGLSFLCPNTDVVRILFGDPEDDDIGRLQYSHSVDQLRAVVAGNTNAFVFGNNTQGNGNAFFGINEESNANMTVGLTINQGANDNEILALKSSDVAHGITSAFGETDTFCQIRKASAGDGGLSIGGATQGTINGIQLSGFVSGDHTVKTTGAGGAIAVNGYKANGATSQAMASNTNIFAVSNSTTCRFILDADGDSHQDVGTAWTNFDHEPDALITRSVGIVMDPSSIVKTRFDDWGRDHKEDLIRTGLIQRLTPEQEAAGERPLMNTTQLMRLHNGAIWQTHVDVLELREAADGLRAELDAERSQRMALEARLNLIEQKGRN